MQVSAKFKVTGSKTNNIQDNVILRIPATLEVHLKENLSRVLRPLNHLHAVMLYSNSMLKMPSIICPLLHNVETELII